MKILILVAATLRLHNLCGYIILRETSTWKIGYIYNLFFIGGNVYAV